jgi:hypothetical protein
MAQPLSEHDEELGSIDDFAPEQPAVQPIDDDLELHHDFEPVALPLPDTRRGAGNARSWFIGMLVPLIVGGVWLGWRAIPPAAAPSEMTAKPIASSTVEPQPIERPGSAPPVPSSSEPDRAVSVDRSTSPVEKPRPAPVEKPRSASVEAPRPPVEKARPPVEKPRPPVEKPRSASVEKPRSASVEAPRPPVERPRPAPVEAPRSAPVAGSPGKAVERPSPPPSLADASRASPPLPGPATTPAPSPPLPVPTGGEVPSALVAAPEPAPASPPATTEPGSPGGASRSGVEVADNVAIQDLLGRYRTAFGALDVAGVRRVWPSVNQRSLERAFRQLEEQDLAFFSCTINVAGVRAEATCVGSSTFIPTVGSRSPQSGPSQWNFKLSKKSAGPWLIDEAQAR